MTDHTQSESPWPLVSVGLPVYNGEHYFEETLRSLLAQDYPNLEIVISDNASTDRTREICLEHAGRDGRIRYHRADQNRGACWNFNRVFALSRGDYFMWAAHDDLWEPSCIRRCVQELEADPEAALCHSSSQPITEGGRPVGDPYRGRSFINDAPTIRGRWNATVRNFLLHATIYGLIRRSLMEKSRLLQVCIGADVVFVAEISLRGKIIQTSEPLSWKRVPESLADYRTHEEMLAYLGSSAPRAPRFVQFSIVRELLRALRHAGLPPGLRLRLTLDTILNRSFAGYLINDAKAFTIAQIGREQWQRWTRRAGRRGLAPRRLETCVNDR